MWWIFNHLKCYVACIFQCIVSICSVHVRLGITCMWTYKFTFGSEQLVCPELSSNHFEYHCQIYLFLSFSVLEYHYDLSGFTISVVNFLCIIGNKYYSYFILVLYLFSIHFCLHLLFLKQYCHPLLTHCHPAMHICSSQQHPFRYQLPAELKPSHCLINQCWLFASNGTIGYDLDLQLSRSTPLTTGMALTMDFQDEIFK